MDSENLIKIITGEIMKRINEINQIKPKKALLLYTGGIIGFEEGCAGIHKMRESGWELRVFMSANAERALQSDFLRDKLKIDTILCESDNICLFDLYEGIDLVVIPTLTLNSLAKSALGIADTAITNLISHFLMTGVPIIAARDACDLDTPMRIELGMSQSLPTYKRLYECYRDMLASYGVRFVGAAEIWQAVQEFQGQAAAPMQAVTPLQVTAPAAKVFVKGFLTRSDLLEYAQDGKIVIGECVRVTDMAADTASQMNIRIVREDRAL